MTTKAHKRVEAEPLDWSLDNLLTSTLVNLARETVKVEKLRQWLLTHRKDMDSDVEEMLHKAYSMLYGRL
jgi:hypothetical protein